VTGAPQAVPAAGNRAESHLLPTTAGPPAPLLGAPPCPLTLAALEGAPQAFGRPPEAAGVVLTATGAGHLAGAVAVTLLGPWLGGRSHRVLGLAVGAQGLAVLAYALSPTLALAASARFALGVLMFRGTPAVPAAIRSSSDALPASVAGRRRPASRAGRSTSG
jgi:hypothetical protein